MATIDQLYVWLLAMSMQVRKPEQVAAQLDVALKVYAEKLTAWPAPVVQRVLERWPSEHEFWPTWHELAEQLPEPGADVPRLRAPNANHESFSDRAWRLKLNMQLGRIRVANWRVVMDRHRSLTDQQMMAALDRLERGQEAFP